eukprot:6208270-Pleurochrysis_carterae.AAC.1
MATPTITMTRLAVLATDCVVAELQRASTCARSEEFSPPIAFAFAQVRTSVRSQRRRRSDHQRSESGSVIEDSASAVAKLSA